MKKNQYLFILLFLLFCCNTVNAYQWTSSEIISQLSTNDAYRQCIEIDSSETIHLIWKDKSNINESGSDWDLFYANKTIHGAWTQQKLITPGSFESITCLAISIDSKNIIHIVWKQQTQLINDTDIYYMKGSGAQGWSEPLLISVNSTGICSCPSIFVDETDTIHLTWADTTPFENSGMDADLYYQKKDKTGDWSGRELVTSKSNSNAVDPSIITDSKGNVHIVWYEKDKQNGTSNIYYANRSGSQEWSDATCVSKDCSGSSTDPSIQVDTHNTIHVLWNDNTPLFNNGYDYDLFYRKKPFLNDWSEIELVSDTSNSNCKWPIMLTHKDIMYTAWSDKTQYSEEDSDYDICFTKKTLSEWDPVEIVSKESTVESNWPRFIVDKNEIIHMTWWDRTSSKWVIYYSKGIPQESTSKDISFISLVETLSIFIITIYIIRNKK